MTQMLVGAFAALAPTLAFVLAGFRRGRKPATPYLMWGLAGLLLGTAAAIAKLNLKGFKGDYYMLACAAIVVIAGVLSFIWSWGVFPFALGLAAMSVEPLVERLDALVPNDSTPFSTDTALLGAGWLLGVGICALIGTLDYLGSKPASNRLLAVVSRIAIALVVLTSLVKVVQVLLGFKAFIRAKWLFSFYFAVSPHTDLAGYALLALAVVPLAGAVIAARKVPAAANPAQSRTHRAAALSRRRFLISTTGLLAASVAGVSYAAAAAQKSTALSPAEPLTDAGQMLTVPLEDISDGHLHRFAYTASDGTEVRFIAIQKNAKAFGIGLDACDVCGATGYYERDGQVICNRCDVAMNIATIGFKGGCNPIPFEYSIKDGKLVVAKAELEKYTAEFK
ncbi:MAG: DUF2318 domain-containing protein [Propionibacteriaceae bacterium]|jgi:uncharacterized membrane protein|nr:DUF2318 domain-containing protein [Propionibacteriaceae bacterium]